jgi:hypothetical protein
MENKETLSTYKCECGAYSDTKDETSHHNFKAHKGTWTYINL